MNELIELLKNNNVDLNKCNLRVEINYDDKTIQSQYNLKMLDDINKQHIDVFDIMLGKLSKECIELAK